MVIATMVIVPNEHEMEKKVLKFSCHKEFGVESELIVVIQLRKIDIFFCYKINKIPIKKSLGKCQMGLFLVPTAKMKCEIRRP